MCPSVVPRITGVEGPSDQRKIRNGAVESDEIAECSESFLTRYIPINYTPLSGYNLESYLESHCFENEAD